jgi:hypothetical protein
MKYHSNVIIGGAKMSSGCEKYGNYYYCIKSDLSENNEIYVYADDVKVIDGDIFFISKRDHGDFVNLSISRGFWKCFFAASLWDGSAVSVEHWKGEVVR